MRLRMLMMRPRRDSSTLSPSTPTSAGSSSGQGFFSTMPNRKSQINVRSSSKHSPATKKQSLEKTSFFHSPVKLTVSCVLGLLAVILAWDLSKYLGKEDKLDLQDSQTGRPEFHSTGGWRLADEETEKIFSTSICNIERRSSSDLSVEEFERVYRYKKPLIVTFPNGASDWTEPEKWTVNSMKEEYGEWIVVSSNSRDIVRQGGTGRYETSLTQFVDNVIRQRDNINEPYYVFDREFYNDSSLPLTLKPPAYFEIKDGVDDSIFFLGSSRSGVTFHKHADSWNGVLYGQKHWFLYPIETTPPGGVHQGYTQLEWYANIYPKIPESQRPIQCVQKAGEIFYLPEGIYHATINLGDTVAIGIQKKEATSDIEKLFYEENSVSGKIEAGDPHSRQLKNRKKEIFETLLHLLPDNTEVHMKAGNMYRELGLLDKAAHHTQRAIDLDPHFIVAVLNMAVIQTKLENLDAAEKLYKQALSMNSRLWDVYAKYGDFLVNHHRPADAIPIYKKGIQLEPKSLSFWSHLQEAQVRAGDKEGAKKSGQYIAKIKA